MARMERSLSEDLVEATFDLEKIFGRPIRSTTLRESIGQEILELIVNRTISGKDRFGRKFQALKNGDPSILRDTGDMLGNLTVTSSSAGSLTIGFRDEDENPKAFNHTTGDTLPRRDFFGLNAKEIDQLKSEFLSEVRELASG